MIKAGSKKQSPIDRIVYSILNVFIQWGRELDKGILWLERQVFSSRISEISIDESNRIVQRTRISQETSSPEWKAFVPKKSVFGHFISRAECVGVLQGKSVLFRKISLPIEAKQKLSSTIHLHAEAMAPIALEKLAFGWTHNVASNDRIECIIGLARKEELEDLTEKVSAAGGGLTKICLVDEETGGQVPVWEKKKRLPFALNVSVFILFALFSVLMLLNDANLSESRNIQLSEFDQEIRKVEKSAKEVAALNNELQEKQNIQAAIRQNLYAENVTFLTDKVATHLPSSMWLSSILIQPKTVLISGYAEDVTQVQNSLESAFPGSFIRITTPVTFDNRAKAEKFTLQIELDEADAVQ